MENSISVGLGELVISHDPADVLVAYGLGSCLGIGMYDTSRKIGGMLHAVLPECLNGNNPNPIKYVNSGIAELLNGMTKAGADVRHISIRMCGGASMLVSAALSKTFDIGPRNIQSAHQTFMAMNLKLASEDVGGVKGRTVRLQILTGRMSVRLIGGVEREL
jgi:chemotaxis protein CheD